MEPGRGWGVNIQRKPEWLRKKVNPGDQNEMRQLLGELRLNTVCQQALCPNISECFACGQATFLILGRNCTRLCSFCNVEKTAPLPVDSDEPAPSTTDDDGTPESKETKAKSRFKKPLLPPITGNNPVTA